MSWLSDSTPLIPGGWLSSEYGGHGVRGSSAPSTGTHGPSLLYPDVSLPAEANDEFRAFILTRPPGTLTFFEDSSFIYSGPGGTGTYQGFKNGVSYGVATYTVNAGSPAPAPIVPGSFGPMLGLTSSGQIIVILPVMA